MIKTIIKTMRPFVKIAFWIMLVGYTMAPLYSKFLNMSLLDAYKQPADTATWMLGDIAAIFTIAVYIAMYAVMETCVNVFGADDDDKKAKAQNKKTDQTSDKVVREA